jgi:xanthine/uracil permease
MGDLRYTLNQKPPLGKNLLYALQWLVVVLPLVVISARLMASFLGMDAVQAAALFQKMLLLVGLVTAIQCIRGHKYPLVDGPSAALLLSVAALAGDGYGTVLGGMLTGGLLLFLLGAAGLIQPLAVLFTGRVVGVVLILISLTFLPYLYPMVIGKGSARPHGDPVTLAAAVVVTLAIILISNYGNGFLRNLSILLGILLGYGLMAAASRVDLAHISSAPFLSVPWPLHGPGLEFTLAGTVSFFMANVAVLINGLGSFTAVAEVVGDGDLEGRIRRGITFTGASGMLAALTGTLGTVSYSQSPGVILVTRVGSRYPVFWCGIIMCALSFFTRLTAILVSVPAGVVGAALLVTLASMVGLGISIIGREPGENRVRDHLVVGLPLLMGTSASLLPPEFLQMLPSALRGLVGNGLIVGIATVLVLEHGILRISDLRSQISEKNPEA